MIHLSKSSTNISLLTFGFIFVSMVDRVLTGLFSCFLCSLLMVFEHLHDILTYLLLALNDILTIFCDSPFFQLQNKLPLRLQYESLYSYLVVTCSEPTYTSKFCTLFCAILSGVH
jgi:hypothetical protein